MGRKHILKTFQVITDGDMSGDITSVSSNIEQEDFGSYQFSWSGSSPVGTITVQASLDNTIWTTLQDSDQVDVSIPVSGNTGSAMFSLNELPFKYVRTVYTFTSGTGTLQSYIFAKNKGA